jgi:hypothetical protein
MDLTRERRKTHHARVPALADAPQKRYDRRALRHLALVILKV